ncbi:UNVERIFIED_CONTAM: hypothetical protein Scaly_0709200 [Sesamum calycinum]|uniref:Uncharacterized protein n=1 Tax=Sesamum calycinum TaxID=2727403 RepID=A0AAW2R7L5_9LAMI
MQLSPGFGLNTTQRHRDSDRCEGKCRPIGTEALPEGIITKSSNLEMRPLWDLFQRMWFAKRFLHPDILAEYDYIFLWDEDLGVENFHPGRYLSIIKEEGLQISQPALDPRKSEVHHPITVRRWRSRVHRRFYKFKGGGRCDNNSTSPPCVGWVEMMAPVFSRAAWRCAWYMIQVRRQSYNEMMTFRKRWNKAVEEDECWIDPFKQRTA